MTRESLIVFRRHALSCSLPPCGGGLGRGVAASSVFVAYPPPERCAHSQGFALASFKTAAKGRLLLPRKGGGNKSEWSP
jgi:hypothetical protein